MERRTNRKKYIIAGIFVTLALILGFGIPLGIRLSHRKTIEKLGYSRDFSEYTLKNDLYETIRDLGYNETLSFILMEPDYRAEYYEKYLQISYRDNSNFLQLTNRFLDKNYTPDDINFFFERFDLEGLKTLSEREHLDDVQKYFARNYAKLKDLDRYLDYKEKQNVDIEAAVYAVANNQDLSDYQADETRGDFSIDMLVNKNYAVSEDFEPDDLVDAGDGFQLNQEAFEAFKEMQTAAKNEGLILEINSAYRNVSEQREVMNAQCKQYGQDYCESHVAMPGFSEHHTGLAIDIKTPHNDTFAKSNEFTWLKNHAHEYGFIWRYQANKENYTRYSEEAWHYRYAGKELAQKVKDSGLSYDEYYVTAIENN